MQQAGRKGRDYVFEGGYTVSPEDIVDRLDEKRRKAKRQQEEEEEGEE